ncbi:MAG: effector-associated domain EAD1-containing protein [Anaerolineales bacterium]|nr:MAG: effector-associated domain EAD1-containing protein [Anaerolineales bacterium]
MKLTGAQYDKLSKALRLAFPSVEYLERMVRFKLDTNLHEIGYGDLSNYVFKLIQWAQAQGRLDQLIIGARQSNPKSLDLYDIAQDLNLTVINTPPTRALQRIIRVENSFLDINDWRLKLSLIEFQVCRIEIKLDNGKVAYGTGFLISPDLVITNYHVMQSLIEKEDLKRKGERWSEREHVVFRFDYKLNGESQMLQAGTVHTLAISEWLVDSSPPSKVDTEPQAHDEPNLDELDYAILRVDGEPGGEVIGRGDFSDYKRGWVKIRQTPFEFTPDSPLIVVQHPDKQPLKLSIDTQGIIGINQNGTRVKYKTNTESGSSGSPCFNINWELVALHHLGDPNYSFGYTPTYNQGIPFNAIKTLLKRRNLLDQIQY